MGPLQGNSQKWYSTVTTIQYRLEVIFYVPTESAPTFHPVDVPWGGGWQPTTRLGESAAQGTAAGEGNAQRSTTVAVLPGRDTGAPGAYGAEASSGFRGSRVLCRDGTWPGWVRDLGLSRRRPFLPSVRTSQPPASSAPRWPAGLRRARTNQGANIVHEPGEAQSLT